MADIGVAALHHDLLTVAATVLIGMADQAHVVGIARRRNRRSSAISTPLPE